ncbi:uncharacterized protein LOC134071588 [Sardina pilchardus]|uniref:uncharacterized protein LOC134071588 n=1 Tax=Sardina pilchardus TaxID=27697 RepID=UPI002E1507C6
MDWATSWRLMSVARDRSLWDQDCSYTENDIKDKWAVPQNGPTGFRGWSDSCMPEGGRDDGETNGPMFGPLAQLRCLEASHHQNKKKCSYEWGESWKSIKYTEKEDVSLEEDTSENDDNENEDESSEENMSQNEEDQEHDDEDEDESSEENVFQNEEDQEHDDEDEDESSEENMFQNAEDQELNDEDKDESSEENMFQNEDQEHDEDEYISLEENTAQNEEDEEYDDEDEFLSLEENMSPNDYYQEFDDEDEDVSSEGNIAQTEPLSLEENMSQNDDHQEHEDVSSEENIAKTEPLSLEENMSQNDDHQEDENVNSEENIAKTEPLSLEENISQNDDYQQFDDEDEDVSSEGNIAQTDESEDDDIKQSIWKWGESWKYLHHQFHIPPPPPPPKTSDSPGWDEAWRISRPLECHYEPSESESDETDYNEPLDPYIHGVIMPICKTEKYQFWSAQSCEGIPALAEWEKSWEVVKNPLFLENVKLQEEVESIEEEMESEEMESEEMESDEIEVEESEPDGLPKRLEAKDKYKNWLKHMSALSECDFPSKWKEAWKSSISKPCFGQRHLPNNHKHRLDHKTIHWVEPDNTVALTGPVTPESPLMKRDFTDWDESWKCSSFQSSFRPSATEWKNSSCLGYALRIRREQRIKEVGNEKYEDDSDKYDIFGLPKRGMKPEMQGNYTISPECKESCKSLTHQTRTEEIRARPNQSKPFREYETSESDWAEAFNFTNGTLNQDCSLWHQGWSSTDIFRQEKWITQLKVLNEEEPHNGSSRLTEWTDSWRSTSRQNIREDATAAQPSHQPAQQPQQYSSPSSADWKDSWRSSSTQFRQTIHDVTPMTKRPNFSGFNRYDKISEDNRIKKHMEIQPGKSLHRDLQAGKFSISLNPDVFKESVTPSEWIESWRVATLQRHHHRLKSNSHLLALIVEAEELPSWCRTWKFINLLPWQHKPHWDKDHETFEVEIWPPPVPEYIPPTPHIVEEEEEPAQCVSWRICSPQPPEWDDTPTLFHRENEVLWSRRRCKNDLYFCLNTEILSQELWGQSWRFKKLESSPKPQPEPEPSLVIMSKRDKIKVDIHSQMEETKPFAPMWARAIKLSMTKYWRVLGAQRGGGSTPVVPTRPTPAPIRPSQVPKRSDLASRFLMLVNRPSLLSSRSPKCSSKLSNPHSIVPAWLKKFI